MLVVGLTGRGECGEAEVGVNMGFLKFLLPSWEMCSPRIDEPDRLIAVAGSTSFQQLEVFLEGLDRNAVVLILILGTCGQGLADEGGSLVGVSTCVATLCQASSGILCRVGDGNRWGARWSALIKFPMA